MTYWIFKNYKRHGYKPEDKVRLDNFCKERQGAVEIAKLNDLTNMENKLNNLKISQNWKIIRWLINVKLLKFILYL